jgi:hypothetical protein
VNSRTGLREADFKLLEVLKAFRMFPRTFFALNADLDAHPDLRDLEGSAQRVRSELSWMVDDPMLFTFSALHRLIDRLGDNCGEREKLRLEAWSRDPELVHHSQTGFDSLVDHMAQRIAARRTRALLGSGLSRLSVAACSVLDTIRAQERFMSQDLGGLRQSSEQLRKKQKILQGTLGTLENAIAGLKSSLKRELESDVRETFDLTEGPIVKEAIDMVERYPIPPAKRKELSDTLQLPGRLHGFYLRFRQDLYRYVVDEVNVRAIEFAKDEEAFLHERLRQSSHAFWSLYKTALEDYRWSMAQFQIEVRTPCDVQEFEWTSVAGPLPPSFSSFVDQGAIGPGVLMVKFGLGRFSRYLSRLKSSLGKRKGSARRELDGSGHFEEAVTLVKAETKAELLDAFEEYRRSFQFGYLHGVLEEATGRMIYEFKCRAEMARLDFENLLRQGEAEGEGRQTMVDVLSRTGAKVAEMVKELEELACAVNLDR